MDILFDDMIRQRGASRSYNATSIIGYSPEDFEEDEYGNVPDVKDRSPRIPKINISDVQWIGEELNLFDSIKYFRGVQLTFYGQEIIVKVKVKVKMNK